GEEVDPLLPAPLLAQLDPLPGSPTECSARRHGTRGMVLDALARGNATSAERASCYTSQSISSRSGSPIHGPPPDSAPRHRDHGRARASVRRAANAGRSRGSLPRRAPARSQEPRIEARAGAGAPAAENRPPGAGARSARDAT